ncbi:sigma-54 interaction domain-containing protein [Mesoterricola sediminis]|nr:sigma 54-interacting transcriptional regulator [Mesoterricola sediminis]
MLNLSPSGEAAPLVPGTTPVGQVVEALLASGRATLQVAGPGGEVAGTFDLVDYLRRKGPVEAPHEPVQLHLQDPLDEAPAQPPLADGRLWRELLHALLSSPDKPMAALVDPDERILFSNTQLRQAFPDAFDGRPLRIRDLLPGHPQRRDGDASPISFWYVQNRERCFMVLKTRACADGVGALVLFELTAQLAQGHKAALDEVDLLKRVLDISVEGLQVVDARGVITLVNESFLQIHKLSREESEGHLVTDVIENTRMHIVARTGVPEVDEFQTISGHAYVVSRIPIFKDGKCLGAVGKIVFQDFREIQRLAEKVKRLQMELEALRKSQGKQHRDTRFTFDDIVAVSDSSVLAKERAMMGAPTSSTILLLGESGVGKEVYAQAIHNLSPRHDRPFVRVNCSAITETLIESELFGYAEGAFTGAKKGGRAGKFEQANTGTIFLDEIGDMPLEAQAKLLRVLQEREIDRVGGEGTMPVDIRVIAATNQDLWALVEQKKFRRDLFFRLNVIPIVIPPLRERPADIPALGTLFWADLQKTHGVAAKVLTEKAKRLLAEYTWPGNIRELRNVLERTFTIVRDDRISEDQVRMILLGVGSTGGRLNEQDESTLDRTVEKAERRAIGFALARTNNNKAQAAKLLGISRPLLYRKMSQYDIS